MPGTVQNLISRTLNIWLNFKNINNLNSALKLIDTIPKRFNNIKIIQNTFAHCHFDSPKTDEMFKQLTSNPDVNYSRYSFFYSNYLLSKNNEKKTERSFNFFT